MTAPPGMRTRADRSAPAPVARCLVATDFSPASTRVLERAARLVAAGAGEAHVLHVQRPDTPEPLRREARGALATAMALIREVAREAGTRRVRATASLRVGEPYVEIIRCAREIGADLVVIGRGGSAGSRQSPIGTTALRVTRMSDVPTLLVGRHSRRAYRRPLVALEIDPSARKLMELTRRVVGSNEIPLRVVHAFTVPFESYFRATRDSSGEAYFRGARREAKAAMSSMLDSTGSRQYPLEAILRHGNARSVILNEAVRCRADLIALGTHGRSGVSHLLLGSVAEWVIENTSRDVLIARPVRFTFAPP